MDREDLRALAQEALREFKDSEKLSRIWYQKKDGVRFDPFIVTILLESAVQQYSSSSIDQKEFVFHFYPTAHGFSPKATAKEFVESFYDEIKDIICNPKRQTEAGKLSRYKLGPTCAGLSAFIMHQFGLNEPIAIGIGAYLLIVLLESTKGAFCKMGKQEVRDRVQN
jgi:hypothetical protein